MSEVTGFMDRLLDGADVAWKPLGELAELVRGSGLPKSDFVESGVPAIHYGQIYTYYGLETDSTISFVSEETAQTLKKVNTGDVVITNTSENIEDVGKPVLYLGKEPAVTGGHATIIKFSRHILGKYFVYFTQTSTFFVEKRKLARGAKVIDVSAKDLAKIEIPIPCPDDPEKSLAIQGEIVRILDLFTKLTAELVAELVQREKQYNHYRDQLLTFDEDEVEWKTLGELTQVKTGQSVNKKTIDENPGQFPVINSGREPLGFMDDWNTQDDPIGITSRGAGVGSVTWQEGKYFRGNLNYAVTVLSNDTLDVHYLYHVLEQFQPQIKLLCTFDGIPALNAVNLKKLKIPVPAFAEQARIATILDTFDTLTTSITEGLPREIELRERQYAYYRDQLLSFPNPEAEAA